MTPCPSCGASLDEALACGTCGSRYGLVAVSAPDDLATRLLGALGAAGTPEERGRVRGDLSRVLAEHGRDDLLLAVWTDDGGPEADLWRGAAAVIAQPGTASDGVVPLERALAGLLAAGRHDLVAIARAYLVQAYGASRRIADAERVGDAALVAALKERDAAAVVRSATSRYAAIAYDVRQDLRTALAGLADAADALRAWAPAHAAVLTGSRARVLLTSDPAAAKRMVAALPPPDAATAAMRRAQQIRAAAMLAVLEQDPAALEAALGELGRVPAGSARTEVPLWSALRRAELAITQGDTERALALAAGAMPPPWHRACPLRTEARWLRAEAAARRLPADAAERRRRAAARAQRRAEWFRDHEIGWREMRWRLLAGELLRSVHQRREAVRELARGRALAERLGLKRALEGIEAQLRALGQTPGRARRSDSAEGADRGLGLRALTAREREIAAKVARGATNGDIARALTLAESTVARHLSNILLKLDLPNRRALSELVHAGRDLHRS